MIAIYRISCINDFNAHYFKNRFCFVVRRDFYVHGKVPFKLEVKVFAQSRGPVVNVTTLALLYWAKNRARRVH